MAGAAGGASVCRQQVVSPYYGLVVGDGRDGFYVYFPKCKEPFSQENKEVMLTVLENSGIAIGEKPRFGISTVSWGFLKDRVSQLQPIARLRCEVESSPSDREVSKVFASLNPDEKTTEVVALIDSFWRAYKDAVNQVNKAQNQENFETLL